MSSGSTGMRISEKAAAFDIVINHFITRKMLCKLEKL